mmetsp:Transcript_4799/g.5551  ORF Transcript_4799/g.5551 Transcript_4799/m.5551 type:complete len:241 (+) Transcript_4799:100-822(+)
MCLNLANVDILRFWFWEKFLFDLRCHKERSASCAANEEEPYRAPSKILLKGTNSKKTDGRGDGSTSIDKSCNSSEGLVASLDRGMRGKVGSNSGCNDIIGPSNKDSHNGKHNKKGGGTKSLGILGENSKEHNEATHENSNDSGTTSSEKIRYSSYNDSTGHHTNRVKSSDEVGSNRVKVSSEEVWEPEEQDVVSKLEESECKCVLGNHGDTKCVSISDRCRAIIVHFFSSGSLGGVLLHA